MAWLYLSEKYGNPDVDIHWESLEEAEKSITESYPETRLFRLGGHLVDQDGEMVAAWDEQR